MKILLMTVALAGLFVLGCSQGASSKATVDRADLAPLGAARLAQLSQPENALSTARTMLAAAKNAEIEAKEQVKVAKSTIDAEVADKQAAEAELKAAKKNNDPGRAESARKLVDETIHELRVARLELQWRQQEVKAASAEITQAEAKVEFESAQLELARVQLLSTSDSAAMASYDLEEFRASANRARAALDSAESRAQTERSRANQLRDEWSRASGAPR